MENCRSLRSMSPTPNQSNILAGFRNRTQAPKLRCPHNRQIKGDEEAKDQILKEENIDHVIQMDSLISFLHGSITAANIHILPRSTKIISAVVLAIEWNQIFRIAVIPFFVLVPLMYQLRILLPGVAKKCLVHIQT